MNSISNRNIRLGIFVTVGVIIFTAAVYFVGQKQNMFSESFTLKSTFENVNGLQIGNNVRFSGIDIGSVTAVDIINDSLIEVTMRIKESVRKFIKKDAVATIGTDGLMGNMLVNIYPGKTSGEIVSQEDFIQSYSRIKTDDILNTLNVTNENAAMLTADLLEITQQIKHGKGTVSSVLYDSVMRNELKATVHNLQQATANAKVMIEDLQNLVKNVQTSDGTLNWLLYDTLTEDQIKHTLRDLKNTSKSFSQFADSARITLHKINSGEGTVATLLNDSTVANDLRETIKNLKAGTDAFNQNMEALKHSAFLRKYFRDKDKEKK